MLFRSVQYANGPLYVGFAYHDAYGSANLAAGTTPATLTRDTFAGNIGHARAWNLGGSYDFKVVKLFANYTQGKIEEEGNSSAEVKGRTWHVGASMPMGAHLFRAGYTRGDNRSIDSADARLWSVGYEYAMSKRTSLYANYADLENDRRVANNLNGATTNTGLTGAAGSDRTDRKSVV